MPLTFDRRFDALPGRVDRLSPLVRRVLADNPGPFTFKGTSSYIIGAGEVAIIDPGPDDDDHLAALLAAVGGETVSHILVTHAHRDHSAQAGRLKAATGAPVHGFPAPRAAAGGARVDASVDDSFAPDVALAHGDAIEGRGFTLAALHTPGHMSNHLCFALPQEDALFSGDHVMAWSTSVIAPPDGNMGQYLAALRLLLGRGERIYYPGHGPESRDPRALVRALLEHRLAREAAVLRRVAQGDRTIAEIVAANYADIDPALHPAAALSTLAHLEYLIEKGEVRSDGPAELDAIFYPSGA